MLSYQPSRWNDNYHVTGWLEVERTSERRIRTPCYSRPITARDICSNSATCTIHPWPWDVASGDLDGLYDTPDERLPSYLKRIGAPAELGRYVLLWRSKAGAFGRPLCHTHGGGCALHQLTREEFAGEGCDSRSLESNLGVGGERCRSGRLKEPPPTRYAVPSMLANLLLIVTDACNLRCRYCMLGGGYEGFKPLRAKHMTWDAAKRAIDHFIALNDSPAARAMHDRKINIAFFGGEPLLRGNLIRQVVGYSKSLEKPGCGYWIDFALTTNLNHLPDELAAFLAEHDIGLQISIDGPIDVHDRYRVNAAGRGSFSKMRSNLKKLRDIDPEYFRRRVSSIVTINGNSDLKAINDFFESGDPLIPPVSFVGVIRDLNHSGFHRIHPYDAARMWGQYTALVKEYLSRVRNGVPVVKGQFLYQFVEAPLRVLNNRIIHYGTATRSSYTGACQPGRRLAVSTDGKFHVCERINERFPIGDVETGVDFEKCRDLYVRYYASLPDCDRCWARPVCGTCMANNCRNDTFSFGVRCDDIRNELAYRLRVFCTVLEYDQDALSSNDPLVDSMHFLEALP